MLRQYCDPRRFRYAQHRQLNLLLKDIQKMPQPDPTVLPIAELGNSLMTREGVQKEIAFWRRIERDCFGKQNKNKVKVESGPFHVKFA